MCEEKARISVREAPAVVAGSSTCFQRSGGSSASVMRKMLQVMQSPVVGDLNVWFLAADVSLQPDCSSAEVSGTLAWP